MVWDREPIVITGLGVTTALGDRDQSWRRLLAGETALTLRQPFPELPSYPLAMVGDRPVELDDLVLQTAQATLEDANLWADSGSCRVSQPLEMGLVLGSSRGFQGRLEQACDRRSPVGQHRVLPGPQFHQVLPQHVAVGLAQKLGIQGPLSAPMAACATGLWSLMQAMLMLRAQQCTRVLVIAADAPITRLCLAGFARLGALAKDGMYPFDQHRQGLALGEGAAGFVLETASHAARRNATVYGQILGVGLTADGTHVTAPDETLWGVDRAIHQCLTGQEDGRRRALIDAIGYVHAHGTATQRNDIQEAAILQRWFPDGVPVSSTKGATGHTLGASGGLGLAWSLLALQHQQLPPCCGLRTPAFDLDFVETRDTRPRHHRPLEAVLCLAFGFGGQNGAIALGRPPSP